MKKLPELSLPVVKPLKPRPQKRTREQLQDEQETRLRTKELTKAEKRRLLRRIAYSSRATPSERIKAIETDNRMAGHNEPDRQEVNVTGDFWSFAEQKEGPYEA